MLTDAELMKLLDMHATEGGYMGCAPSWLEECDPDATEYLLALDDALPRLVEEVRRLRAEWAEDDAMWLQEHTFEDVVVPNTFDEKLAYYERENHGK